MHQLHREVVVSTHVSTEFVCRDRIRVLQHRRDSCLSQESLLLRRIFCKFRSQSLVADCTSQMEVLTRANDTLATTGNSLEVHVTRAIVRSCRKLHISFSPEYAGISVRLFGVVHVRARAGGDCKS